MRSGQEKISRRSWAAIQVRASCSSLVSPASSPASSRVQDRSVWWWAARRSSRRMPYSGSPVRAAVAGVFALDAAAHLVNGGEPEAHDMEGV